jgi:hypothetical protein
METMTHQQRTQLSNAAIKRHYRHARDYGTTRSLGVRLADDQITRLEALEPWAPTGEHIRRAVDAYLTLLWTSPPPSS